MRSLSWKLCLTAGISCLALLGNAAPAVASEDIPAAPDERLQQLEQRLSELADRQEQALRRFDAALAAREQMGRQPAAALERQEPAPAPPAAGINHPVAARILQQLGDMARLMILGWLLCNVLLAIWIFMDIRKRGEGSGIFVVLALVAGIPAAIIYSLTRIGDRLSPNGK
jgi:hypothetical protein